MNHLYVICLVFRDRDGALSFEHGLTVGVTEEDALMTAMEAVADAHEGHTMLHHGALEVTPEDVQSLTDAMDGPPRENVYLH